MKNIYCNIINCVGRAHRVFLDLLKNELNNLRVLDINSVQCLLLYNIGNQQISISELISRGLYSGSNVSHNIKKLVQSGYAEQIPSKHDKRSVHVRLSEKGLSLYRDIDKCLEQHASKMELFFQNKKAIESVYKGLQGVETFWSQNSLWLR
ncbi:MAG: MarR family transcriptional regulator [Holosporales bacterium]|jgi:DNA-binding MarR family transcriptional regulator|nr:MarR family transcriptional regulator [Holosporales bacterium]